MNTKLMYLKDLLEALGCPFLEDTSESWFSEMLFQQSEIRTKLLVWLVCKFNPDFSEVISDTVTINDSRIDSRHKKLLFLLNIIGVCKIDDLDLVKGTVSQRKQLVLWYSLIETVYTSQMGHSCLNMLEKSDKEEATYYLCPAKAPSFTDVFQSTCVFTDTLVREHKMEDLFSGEVNLFSPDLDKKIEEELKVHSTPSSDLLAETTKQISGSINDLHKQLDCALAKFIPMEIEQSVVENYCRKMDLSFKMFLQMLENFLHFYENEIEIWCNDKSPDFSPMASEVNSTKRMFENPVLLQQAIDNLKKSMSDLAKSLFEDAKKLSSKSYVDGTYLAEMLSILQESSERLK